MPPKIWSSPQTTAAVLRNGKAHASEFSNFGRIFGRGLDDFWGRPGKDFDDVTRMWPSNASGFHLDGFLAAFQLGPEHSKPDKASRKRFLSLIRVKWGEPGVATLTQLLPRPSASKRK